MTPTAAALMVGSGVVLFVAAAVWLLGPWGLLGCALALIVSGLLLVPVKERRGEPADLAAPEA